MDDIKVVTTVETDSGYKLVILMKFGDKGRVDAYSIDERVLSEQERIDIYKKRVNFTNKPHSHWAFDLRISGDLPIYVGDGPYRDAVRTELQRKLDALRNKSGSYETLLTEIQYAVQTTDVYSQEIWDRGVQWRKVINDLETNFLEDGIDAHQLLFPLQAVQLKVELNRLFDHLKRIRSEVGEQNYQRLKQEAEACLNTARETTEWFESREKFKQLQQEFKTTDMSREHRDELWQILNEAFSTLGNRQTEEREAYKRECEENYHSLYNKASEIIHHAQHYSDTREVREEAKQLQADIKEAKLFKEQRGTLWEMINKIFHILNERQIEWLEESIRRDEEFLQRQRNNLDNVRPGGREYEIRSSINSKIEEVEEKIASKHQRIEQIRNNMR